MQIRYPCTSLAKAQMRIFLFLFRARVAAVSMTGYRQQNIKNKDQPIPGIKPPGKKKGKPDHVENQGTVRGASASPDGNYTPPAVLPAVMLHSASCMQHATCSNDKGLRAFPFGTWGLRGMSNAGLEFGIAFLRVSIRRSGTHASFLFLDSVNHSPNLATCIFVV